MRYTFEPSRKRRVGLIAGTFERMDDAMRQGLKEARARCDRLVIGLSALPVETMLERKRALDELGCADSIFTYGDPSEYLGSIEDLGPHERLDHLICREAA